MRLLLAVDWPPLVDGFLVKGAACIASSYLGAAAIARIDARRAVERASNS